MNSFNAGAWEFDLATRKLASSVDARRLSGRKPNGRDSTYEEWLDTIHPDDRIATARSLREAIAAGREVAVEWRTRHPGDAQRWLMARGGPVRNADGSTQRYTGVVIDITDRKRAEEKIGYLALHDTLTGLPNRAAFNERLAAAIAKADETGTSVAVLCLDLDRFKEVNDVFGHACRRRALAPRVATSSGRSPTAQRSPASAATSSSASSSGKSLPDRAWKLAERLRGAVAAPFDIDGRQIRISIGIGAALYPDHGDVEAVLANADAALYRAKAPGGGDICFFDSGLDTRLRERRALLQDLENALERNELLLHYQPQAAADGEIFGFEALLRWRHPRRGLVAPGEFVPVAEESGLIAPIGEWVLREACREAASWPLPKTVGVNLSPKQFLKEGLPQFVHAVLLETGLASASARTRDHRERSDRRFLARVGDAAPVESPGRESGDGRLRHGLFVAVLSSFVPVRQNQDRRLVRFEPARKSELRAGHQSDRRPWRRAWRASCSPRAWKPKTSSSS